MDPESPQPAPRQPRTGDLIRPVPRRGEGRPPRSKRKVPPPDPVRWPGYLGLFLLALIAFTPLFRSEIFWPSYEEVPRSAFPSLSGLTEAWSLQSIREADPFTLSSYFLERALPLPPVWAHLSINLLLHLSAAVLLLRILEALKLPGAFAAAAVFTLHPAVLPAMFWTGYREELLGTVLILAALLPGLRMRHAKDFLTMMLLAALAMLAHPAALALPPILALAIFFQRKPVHLADFNHVLPLAAMALFLAVWLQSGSQTAELASAGELLALGSQNLFFFFEQTFLPLNPAVFDPFAAGKIYRVGASSEILPFAFFLPFYTLCFFNLGKRWARGLLLGLSGYLLFALHGVFHLGTFIDGSPARETAMLYTALPFIVALIVCGLAAALHHGGSGARGLWRFTVGGFLLLQLVLTASMSYTLGQTPKVWLGLSESWPGSWQAKAAYLESLRLGRGYDLPPAEAIEHLEGFAAPAAGRA